MTHTVQLPGPDFVSAFMDASGLVVTEASGTRVVGYADLDQRHHTPFGVVHGGVYAAIVESAGSIGASLAVADRGQFSVGLNNSTDFCGRRTAAGRGWWPSRSSRGARSNCG